MNELPIIEKTYELIRWYIPIIDRMPRTHKFTLGDRIVIPILENCTTYGDPP